MTRSVHCKIVVPHMERKQIKELQFQGCTVNMHALLCMIFSQLNMPIDAVNDVRSFFKPGVY